MKETDQRIPRNAIICDDDLYEPRNDDWARVDPCRVCSFTPQNCGNLCKIYHCVFIGVVGKIASIEVTTPTKKFTLTPNPE